MPKKPLPAFVVKVEGAHQKILRTPAREDYARDAAREISRRVDPDVVIEVRARVPHYAAGTKRKLADRLLTLCRFRDGRLIGENLMSLMAGVRPD